MWTKENKPWIIQNERFTSRKTLMARLRSIAEGNNWRIPGLHLLSQADEDFVLAFFAQHSSIEEKVGAGVKRVLVGSSREIDKNAYHNWCYYFETEGRSAPIDVGAGSCFESYTKLEDFREACYTTVAARATAVLNRDFGTSNEMRCPETSEIVGKQDCFVSYCDPSMREIVQKFIDTRQIDVEIVEIEGETKRKFKDDQLARCFFAFHGNLARMRVVGQTAFYKRMQRSCVTVPLARDSVGV